MEEKKALRLIMKRVRDSLDAPKRIEKSQSIFETLKHTSLFQSATHIAFYLSFGSEVVTDFMIDQSLAMGKKILVPKIIDDEFILVEFTDFNSLTKGNMGVREPESVRAFELQPDLIVVPGLAFDKTGHRLGYGKGHYDRFLKHQKGKTIGVAFKEQIVEQLPKEKHDIKLDDVITD